MNWPPSTRVAALAPVARAWFWVATRNHLLPVMPSLTIEVMSMMPECSSSIVWNWAAPVLKRLRSDSKIWTAVDSRSAWVDWLRSTTQCLAT